MTDKATLDLAKLLIRPESNLKEIGAFEDAANAIACGYIDQAARIERLEKALRWYADIHQHPTSFALDALKKDEGKVAREALLDKLKESKSRE